MTPHPEGANLKLAEHYLEVGQPARTLELLDQIGNASLEDDHFWYMRAQALYSLEHYYKAREAAERGLAITPESLSLLYLHCNIEQKLGNLAAAERAILTALQMLPEHPSLLCRYALLVAEVGQLDKAQALVARAAMFGPSEPEVMRAQTILAYLQGDDHQMERTSRELLAQNPDDISGHALRGNALFSLGNPRQATQHFHQAARLDPTDTNIVAVARQSRAATHWLLWPLAPFRRFGVVQIWFAAIAIMYLLNALGFSRASGLFALAYLFLCVYSWVIPPLLRWWFSRRGRFA